MPLLILFARGSEVCPKNRGRISCLSFVNVTSLADFQEEAGLLMGLSAAALERVFAVLG
jgi:hypothetical protein